MIIAHTIGQVREEVRRARQHGAVVGLVPTMGALHAGHLSCLGTAREQCSFTVMSIFVNPIQFNSSEDLKHYPRTLEADRAKVEAAGLDLLFVPDEEEMYGSQSRPGERSRVQAGSRSRGLCGEKRPGHFDGVVTVVSMLFNIVEPDLAVFGEKDFQQLKVIEQLCQDLKFAVRIVPSPLVRDSDGLALSSRNARLSQDERSRALAIPKALFQAQALVRDGENSSERIIRSVTEAIAGAGLVVDYVAVVDRDTLEPRDEIAAPARLLVAAFCGPVRLIDNVALGAR